MRTVYRIPWWWWWWSWSWWAHCPAVAHAHRPTHTRSLAPRDDTILSQQPAAAHESLVQQGAGPRVIDAGV